LANRTWKLVSRPPHANIVSGKWVFKHKFCLDGSFNKYKARWVVCRFTQQSGVHFSETFAPVIKPGTIRMVLTIATNKHWSVRQLDVSNVFLHCHLQEHVFSHQPTVFVNVAMPDAICALSKSLYRLKQAPHAWFHFAQFVVSIGFRPMRSDSSLFVYKRGPHLAYLLLYVDDMILTASSMTILCHTVDQLKSEFVVMDVGELRFFLRMEIRRSATKIFFSQDKYADDILDRVGTLNCKPSPSRPLTPLASYLAPKVLRWLIPQCFGVSLEHFNI
jgi:hypothetical protein